MNDAASGPVHANAIVAQKTMSAEAETGTIVCRVIGVAVPKRRQIASPRPTSKIVSSQRAIAPALLSHFALASPRTLSATRRRRGGDREADRILGDALAAVSRWPDQKWLNSAGRDRALARDDLARRPRARDLAGASARRPQSLDRRSFRVFRLADMVFWATIAFAWTGPEAASFMGGEIRDPRRTVPRAFAIAAPMIAAIYISAPAASWSLFRRSKPTRYTD